LTLPKTNTATYLTPSSFPPKRPPPRTPKSAPACEDKPANPREKDVEETMERLLSNSQAVDRENFMVGRKGIRRFDV